MFITAQRVVRRSPDPPQSGINAFLYRHGAQHVWEPEGLQHFLPETNPGELERQLIEVHPVGGNPVLAYLDVVAPDETSPWAISASLQAMPLAGVPTAFPHVFVQESILVRLDLVPSVSAMWIAEYQQLCRRIRAVLGSGLPL